MAGMNARTLAVVLLAPALAMNACRQKPKVEAVDYNNETAYNPMPVNLVDLDSNRFQLRGRQLHRPIIAVFFNPECDHCRQQAEELAEHRQQLEDYIVLMIASAPLPALRTFADQLGLSGLPYVHFTLASPVDVYNVYGDIRVPHTVLYSEDHRKIHEFKGVTGTDEILRYLP